MKTTIANLLLILFVFYCGTLAFLYFKQGSFIFFPTGISKSKEFLLKQFSQFEVNINHDGFNLHGWFMNREISSEHPLIIYYGGNAEEVSNNLFDLEKYEKESLLFMNYRGYGKCDLKYQHSSFSIFQNRSVAQNVRLILANLSSHHIPSYSLGTAGLDSRIWF